MINSERLVNRFLEYVQVDSETGFEKAMSDKLTADLQALGFNAIQDNVGEKIGSTGNNVYCYLEGEADAEPILLTAHLDTVIPGKGIVPVLENGIISSKGETVLGGDDKSGVVAMVELLLLLREQGIKHRPIECLFTVSEESGLRGAKGADYGTIKSKMALALDNGGDVGAIITTAPGQLKLKATITGKPAHAGIAPETGVSAIMAMASAVSKMKLLRIDEETTANIGTFTANSPTNIVCETATLIAEARSRSNDKLKAQGEHMVAMLQEACDQFGATLDAQLDTSYMSYSIPADAPVVNLVKTGCEKLGLPVTIGSTGGGSDANVFNLHGISSIVLGTGMSKVHTTEEFISVENLENLTKLLLEIAKV